MKATKDTTASFIMSLINKDLDLASSLLSDECNWYTGNHFGTFIGKSVCLHHLHKIFVSFPTLKFSAEWVACENETCVFEYAFQKKDQDNKKFNGVFILKIVDKKIQSIRNYYEDRTTRPRNLQPERSTKRATSASKNTKVEREKNYPGYDPKAAEPYDPITGLPLK